MTLEKRLTSAFAGDGRWIGLLALLFFVLLRFSLDPVLEDRSPYVLFTLAVMVGAMYGGFWTAVAIAAVGGAAGIYFIASALGPSRVLTAGHMVHVALYFVVCVAIAALVDVLRRARRRVERSAMDLADLAERLRRADRAKDEFLTLVSHELRTPLNAIVGWSHLLASGDLDEGRTKAALETVLRNAERQDRLIGDLLDGARIAEGKLRLQLRVIEPHAFVEEALAALQPAADAKRIRLEMDGHRVGPLRADPERLLQIVRNLLANAIKFTPEGGRVEVILTATESHVRLVVKDNGPGIPPELLPRLFERFAQARPGGGGLGLGLALCRELVEMHGGSISVRNIESGRGARFELVFPRAAIGPVLPFQYNPDFGEFAETRRALLRDVRVLLVEDEPDACRALASLIGSFGAEVVAVDSAEAALRAIAERRPDVMLADINLGGDDGWTLLKKVREIEPDRGAIPAAALSGRCSRDDKHRSYEAGFRRHITKPAEPAEVIAVLATLAATRTEAGVSRAGRPIAR
jgi:signal transduction histidine kinase/CheY-like chemotaxis protein